MRIRTATTALLVAGVLALTACSSSGSSNPTPDEPGVTATVTAAGQDKPATLDAAAITDQLAAAVPTVTTTVAYTESTDPNKRMGRPHQYLSKTAFADSRVPKAKAKEQADGRSDAISYGGTVEVFATDADAKAWVDGIDTIGQAVGSFVTPDYLLRQGRYVIRASSILTPGQVDGYKAVLAKL
jgi:hypothetical protein